MKPIDVNYIKKAVRIGQLEFFVQKDIIYVNDCYNGNCVQLGNVKGNLIEENDDGNVD